MANRGALMSEQICRHCRRLLVDGDFIKAEVLTRFVGLKSKISYALERPTECHWVEHENCNWPQGREEE